MSLQVVNYYFDENRKGPFATSWYNKYILGDSNFSNQTQSAACVGMEEPLGRLFTRKSSRGLAAALVIKLLGMHLLLLKSNWISCI